MPGIDASFVEKATILEVIFNKALIESPRSLVGDRERRRIRGGERFEDPAKLMGTGGTHGEP